MSRAKTSYSTTIFSLNLLNNHNPNGFSMVAINDYMYR